ncbi:MAG: hypothetical protein HOO86_08615 [Bacteroidales bacterium]|nr:hypothetical protein [Bacteroidales bacterium]
MGTIKTICILTLLTFSLTNCSQTRNDRAIIGRSGAEQELKSTLADMSKDNFLEGKRIIIKDSVTAISVAEPILFSIYGKDNIIKQRPYETFLIDKYWIINGTLPIDYLGGTFLIIIDSQDSKIIKIFHGK